MKKLIGPFSQVLPLSGLPLKGSLPDHLLTILKDGGILVEDGKIVEISPFDVLRKSYPEATVEEIEFSGVLLPGFIDCHTHLCYAGNRAEEYALRSLGKTYLDISEAGGGIWNTVQKTRAASSETLLNSLVHRIERHQKEGVTTIEIKSGYGLDVANELKQLKTIQEAVFKVKADLIPTCLAAHLKPKDFKGNNKEYLSFILRELLPQIIKDKLAHRVDIFIERSAFSKEEALPYLTAANFMGFEITIHADQFTSGGSTLAYGLDASSVDHLEVMNTRNIAFLAKSNTIGVVLPGSSLGLGNPFAPARKILDEGAALAIASDWNPGSSPMGDLLITASLLGVYEKLSATEVFAGLTYRAAAALRLEDRGTLKGGQLADLQAYPCTDYREILYNQGKLKPVRVWKKGMVIA